MNMLSNSCGGFILITTSCIITYTYGSIIYKSNKSMSCITPDHKQGKCISVHNCHPLLRLASDTSRKPEVTDYLRKAHCGFTGTIPLVCCPKHSLPDFPPKGDYTTNGNPTFRICPRIPIHGIVSNHKNFRLLPKDCGYGSKGRIAGGDPTGLGQYPWMALLQYTRKTTGKKTYKCGGVLINWRYVLTAAHCIYGNPESYDLTAVVLGEHNISTDPDCEMDEEEEEMKCNPSPIVMGIEKVVMHPQYIPDVHIRSKHDIGLIRLDKGIPVENFNTYKPICFPRGNILAKDYVHSTARAAGWGRAESSSSTLSDVLLHVNLPVIDTKECAHIYDGLDDIDTSQICAGGAKGKDTCKGDSGGPLMVADMAYENESFRFYVIGIVSFGPEHCGTEGWPGVFTKVSAHAKWILDQLEE